MEKPEPKKALVDGDILVYRFAFAAENETEALCLVRVTDFFIEDMFEKLGVDDYQIYITGVTNFRTEVAVTQPYKGNRAKTAKPRHYKAVRNKLLEMGAIETKDEEADDAIAIEATKERDKVWIVSIDKDFKQVPGFHYNFVKEIKEYVSDEEALLNFYTQVLTGDRTDNIKGVEGYGPKKAEKALKDCKTAKEMWDVCVELHGSIERATEDATLLYLRRTEGETWQPPS